jgi:hypothetical protein
LILEDPVCKVCQLRLRVIKALSLLHWLKPLRVLPL